MQFGQMKRREIVALIGSAIATWPLSTRAQPSERVRRVGALIAFAKNDFMGQAAAAAFREGLEQLGWMQGRNIQVEYRFASGDPALYKTYAVELVRLAPDAILAGASPAVAALEPLTRTIPIVFVLVVDPIGQGFVTSLARPGGNITGFSAYDAPIMGKWVSLLNEIAPSVKHVAVIFNPETAPFANLFNRAIETAAQSFGIAVTLAPVHDETGIEAAVAAEAAQAGGAVIALPESFVVTHRKTLIAAAAHYRLPAVGMNDLFPRDGALMSYWIDTVDTYRQAASYIDRILKGVSPGELPIQQPTKFLFLLNIRTAKRLGLEVPLHFQQLADELIE